MLIICIAAIIVYLIGCFFVYRYSPKISIALVCLGCLVSIGVYTQKNRIRRYIWPRPQPVCAVNSKSLSFSKDDYALHRSAGEQLPQISLAENNTQRDALIQKEILVSLQNSEGYIVKPMKFGSPYVHSNMFSRIQEIEKRFVEKQKQHKISGVQFVITSAYRTLQDQEKLRKVNRNGTKGISSHSYGASIDVAKLRGTHCQEAIPLFEEVIQEMQKENMLYLCPESITVHLTARVE